MWSKYDKERVDNHHPFLYYTIPQVLSSALFHTRSAGFHCYSHVYILPFFYHTPLKIVK